MRCLTTNEVNIELEIALYSTVSDISEFIDDEVTAADTFLLCLTCLVEIFNQISRIWFEISLSK